MCCFANKMNFLTIFHWHVSLQIILQCLGFFAIYLCICVSPPHDFFFFLIFNNWHNTANIFQFTVQLNTRNWLLNSDMFCSKNLEFPNAEKHNWKLWVTFYITNYGAQIGFINTSINSSGALFITIHPQASVCHWPVRRTDDGEVVCRFGQRILLKALRKLLWHSG